MISLIGRGDEKVVRQTNPQQGEQRVSDLNEVHCIAATASKKCGVVSRQRPALIPAFDENTLERGFDRVLVLIAGNSTPGLYGLGEGILAPGSRDKPTLWS